MPATIPDLWPETFNVDGLPPVVILKAQASKLAEKTMGIVEAEVITDITDEWGANTKVHSLDLIAPALGNYKHRVLQLVHRDLLVYPLRIRAMEGEQERSVQDQSALIQAVSEILRSPGVKNVIDSLIVRSNEATGRVGVATAG